MESDPFKIEVPTYRILGRAQSSVLRPPYQLYVEFPREVPDIALSAKIIYNSGGENAAN